MFRGRLVHAFHASAARISPLSPAHHPTLAHTLHIARNITPDLSVVLLALAGLSYLMPEAMEKIEKHKALRRSIAFVLIFFGMAVIILNEVAREDQEKKDIANSVKLDAVSGQNGQILQAVLADRTVSEVERRRRIENSLRNEYILHHSDISPAMLAGIEYPPAAWMNDRLRQLGENWTFGEPHAIKAPTPQIVQQMAPEQKQSKIQVGLYDPESDKLVTEITVPSQDGFTVEVYLTAKVINGVLAKNGALWYRVCATCNWAKEPEGFDAKEETTPKDRERHFQQLLPGAILTPRKAKIAIPMFPKSPGFEIAGFYSCENCPVPDPNKGQKSLVHVIPAKQQ